MADAVVAGFARSPIGRGFKGALSDVRADDLGGRVVDALLTQLPQVDRSGIADTYWGCSLPHFSSGYNMARQVVMLAGLPVTVPATTMVRSCGSSGTALRAATHAIGCDDGDIYLVGGSDSFSLCYGKGFDVDDENPRFNDPTRPDFVNLAYIPVFDTAELVADKYGITREEMDAFALRSQERAARARDDGYFADEIVPYEKSDGTVVVEDDCLRPATTLEGLAALRPICPERGGRVTAGNTCVGADGASAMLVMSESRARELEIQPMARIVATAVSGCEPELMGIGPIEASRKALDRAGLVIGDLDIVECHENFSVQVLAVCEQLKIDIERQLNPFGGAIALGHPPGMTGVRLIGTLIHGLQARDGMLGLASTCVAGGQGVATIVERLA
jgi:acetyl-CoA C-acetyltransferase